MAFKRSPIVTIFLCFLSLNTVVFAKDFKTTKIQDVKKSTQLNQMYQIEGFVNYISKCPLCSPPQECKPCEGPHLILAGEKALWPNENYPEIKMTDVLIVNKKFDHDVFKLGEKYKFKIKSVNLEMPLTGRAFEVVEFDLVKRKEKTDFLKNQQMIRHPITRQPILKPRKGTFFNG